MRAQPLHNGHVELLRPYLERGERVLILLMNTPQDDNNPFSIDERIVMFDQTFRKYREAGQMMIVTLPPIVDVNIGRSCGYKVLDSAGLEGISASAIRAACRQGLSKWVDWVPKPVIDVIMARGVSRV